MYLRVNSMGGIVRCDEETNRRIFRDYAIKERLFLWKRKIIEFRIERVNQNWKKVYDFLVENNIECTEEDVTNITHDIVVSIKDYNFRHYCDILLAAKCDDLDLIMSREYLESIYNNETNNNKQKFEAIFQRELSCRIRAIDWKVSHLCLKELIPLISVLFYDGIALLYSDNL